MRLNSISAALHKQNYDEESNRLKQALYIGMYPHLYHMYIHTYEYEAGICVINLLLMSK